jgi:hypothetical protein
VEIQPFKNSALASIPDLPQFFISPQATESGDCVIIMRYEANNSVVRSTLASFRFEGLEFNHQEEFASIVLYGTKTSTLNRVLTFKADHSACFTFMNFKFELGIGLIH